MSERDVELNDSAEVRNLGLDLAEASRLAPPLVDREELVARVQKLLDGGTAQPLLLGDPGVGKTSLAIAVAKVRAATPTRIGLGKGPIMLTTPIDLVAGAIYANQLEHKLRLVAKNLERTGAILFLDDLLGFVGLGASSSKRDGDVLSFLLPFVRRGDLRVLAGATREAWSELHVVAPEWARLLSPVVVPPLDVDATRRAIAARARWYGARDQICLTNDAVAEAIDVAPRLFPSRALPGVAFDLLEAVLADVRTKATPLEEPTIRMLGQSTLSRLAARALSLPPWLVDARIPLQRSAVERALSAKVIGQEPAVAAVAERIQMVKARMCPSGRPLGAFLLCGPTGVGKTLLARTTAGILLGDEQKLCRFDMSEITTSDAVDRFVGETSRKGRRAGLVDAALCHPFPVILLDEIEKAHPAALDVLLQVLGEGRLTDGTGRTARFDNALFFLTSNLGAGRASIRHPCDDAAAERQTRRAVSLHLRPELLARLTGVLVCAELKRDDAARIALVEVHRLHELCGLTRRGVKITLTDSALGVLVDAGFSSTHGARPMQRAIEALVAAPVARLMAEAPPRTRANIVVDSDGAGGTRVRVLVEDTVEQKERKHG